MTWIQTYTGRQFHVMEPRAQEVHREDIAHALSLLCRFNGHVDRFYSVAEHCFILSHVVSPKAALWALLHDAAEAYVGDMTRPLKQQMQSFIDVEFAVILRIIEHFKLTEWFANGALTDEVQEVHEADARILLNERAALMPRATHNWSVDGLEPLDLAESPIVGWPPRKIERLYLQRLEELLETRLPVESLSTDS